MKTFVVSNKMQLVWLVWRLCCSWWHQVRCGTTYVHHRSWKVTHAAVVLWVTF